MELQNSAKFGLSPAVPVFVKLNHNLAKLAIKTTTWIQCQVLNCRAIFQSLKRLLQHERRVHGHGPQGTHEMTPEVEIQSRKSRYYGTYQLFSLRTPVVKLHRIEVDKWLELQEADRNVRRRLGRVRVTKKPDFDLDPDYLPRLGPQEEGSESDDEDDDRAPLLPSNWSLPYKCEKCRAQFARPEGLKKHQVRRQCSASLPHACPYCKQHFRHTSALRTHVKTKHLKVNGELPGPLPDTRPGSSITCSKCDIIFPTLRRLQSHELLHAHGGIKPFACTYGGCNKRYLSRYGLRLHLDNIHRRIHRHNDKLKGAALADPSYACKFPPCGKVLSSRRNLRMHHLTHTEECQFKCRHGHAGCKAEFKTWHGRIHHERRVHTRELPFNCQYCGKGFTGRQYCQTHELRSHTKEKTHVCTKPGCGKRFVMKHCLVEHERRHNKDKRLMCKYCEKAFVSSHERNRHQQRHEIMAERMRQAKTATAAAVTVSIKVDSEGSVN